MTRARQAAPEPMRRSSVSGRRSCRDVEEVGAWGLSVASSGGTAPPAPAVRELSFRDFSEIPVRHLFRPPLLAPSPALGGDYPVYLFAPGYLVDHVGAPAFDRLNPDPNHIPNLDFRAGHLVLGPAPDVAQSNLCHFGVRVGEVRRHLRGSVLPSVDLAQDVSQHEVPLPPPARSGCYAAQHGLLDGADGALREVGVAPGHLLLDVPEVAFDRSCQVSSSTPRQWARTHHMKQRSSFRGFQMARACRPAAARARSGSGSARARPRTSSWCERSASSSASSRGRLVGGRWAI